MNKESNKLFVSNANLDYGLACILISGVGCLTTFLLNYFIFTTSISTLGYVFSIAIGLTIFRMLYEKPINGSVE